jgi:hypothetical protein
MSTSEGNPPTKSTERSVSMKADLIVLKTNRFTDEILIEFQLNDWIATSLIVDFNTFVSDNKKCLYQTSNHADYQAYLNLENVSRICKDEQGTPCLFFKSGGRLYLCNEVLAKIMELI